MSKEYTITVNGKEQNGTGAAVLAAIIASPFAAETADIVSAVLKNEKLLAVLSLIDTIVYEDNAKSIRTTGRALLDTLPGLAEYHQQASALAEKRKELNSFRDVTWKKKRGRKNDDPKLSEFDLDL